MLPNQVSDQPAQQQPQPPVERGDTSDEAKELRDKIAELEKQKLEEKIEDLEKKIDQKNKVPTSNWPRTTTTSKSVPDGFGRINSPGDGFLALRSEPSVSRGVRVSKIPHGKTVRVYSCGGRTIVGGRSGRWCQVVYRRDIGWVFDAYLIR
jgi:hypothetical protein